MIPVGGRDGKGRTQLPFRYLPRCSARGCDRPAVYKVASTWSSAAGRELKNYGLSCEEHAAELLQGAQSRRQELAPAEGEAVGEVGLYRLEEGRRDVELKPIDV